jgi:hypothetical protein
MYKFFLSFFAAAKKQIEAHGKSYCDSIKMGVRDAETLANYQLPSSPSSAVRPKSGSPKTQISKKKSRSQNQNPDLKTVPPPPTMLD